MLKFFWGLIILKQIELDKKGFLLIKQTAER
jgi:hypothetical protein